MSATRLEIRDALKAQLEGAGLTVVQDDPRAPLPSVVIVPPAIDGFYETDEEILGDARTLWPLGLYSVVTFDAADQLLDAVLTAVLADQSLGGTVVRVAPQRVEYPLRDQPEGNNKVRYRRLVVLLVEHELGA